MLQRMRAKASDMFSDEKTSLVMSSSTGEEGGEAAAKDAPKNEGVYRTWFRPLVAEFIGQLVFVFVHCCTANAMTSSVVTSPVAPALAHGLTGVALIMLTGHLSGGHFNFAVTAAVYIGGGIRFLLVPLYLIAQLLGSLTGAALAKVITRDAMGYFELGAKSSESEALLAEIVFTSFLTLVVLVTAVDLKSPSAPFAIGFTIAANIMAGSTIDGACMNPTLSIGPAVLADSWNSYWVYWVGPLIGALVSGVVFRVFLREGSSGD